MNDIFDFTNPGEIIESYKNSRAQSGFYNGFSSVTFYYPLGDQYIDTVFHPLAADYTKLMNSHVIRDTWKSWHLVPKNKLEIVPPKVKTNYISVPASMGKIDLSEALTGYPLYENREGTLSFQFVGDGSMFHQIYSDILTFLNGQRLYMVLNDSPEWYFIGRFSVGKYSADNGFGTIDISYDVFPYKIYRCYPTSSSTANDRQPWNYHWDTFNFINGQASIIKDEDKGIMKSEGGFSKYERVLCKANENTIVKFDNLGLMYKQRKEYIPSDYESYFTEKYEACSSWDGSRYMPTKLYVSILNDPSDNDIVAHWGCGSKKQDNVTIKNLDFSDIVIWNHLGITGASSFNITPYVDLELRFGFQVGAL